MRRLQESASWTFDRVYLCVVFKSRQVGPLTRYTCASSSSRTFNRVYLCVVSKNNLSTYGSSGVTSWDFIIDMLESLGGLYNKQSTLAAFSVEIPSLNLRVMWSNFLRVVGITPSFITRTVQVKKFWGILNTLSSIWSHHDLCTVIAYLSELQQKGPMILQDPRN